MSLLKQKYLIYLCSFAIIGIHVNGVSQEAKGVPYNVKGSYNLGFMIAHRVPMQHIPQTLSHGFELSIEKQGENKKDWERLYNSPTVGVSFLAASTGNASIMGFGYGLNGYVLIPIIKKQRFNLETSWGWGLGLLSKKFDPVTNYKNNVIGSNLNLFAAIKLIGEVYLSKQLAVSFGASFHHWSNSAYKYPNLGLNLPSLNLGAIYKFREQPTFGQLNKEERKSLAPIEKNEFSLIPNIGFKAYSVHDNSTYPAYSLEFNYARLWSSKFKVSAGVEFIYNTAYQRELEISVDSSNHDKTAFQTGINVTYHQTLGPFSLLLGMGTYVIDPTLQNELFYHRVGTRYVFKERIILSTMLYTHWARADHLKIGVGYKFRK